MHDPNTVTHEFGSGIWRITIWHVDPEVGGDEDSCDWFGSHIDPHLAEEIENLPEPAQQAVRFIWWQWHNRLEPRPWWKHPKWHVHHWRVQVVLFQLIKRFLFTRCDVCGGRFRFRESPISTWSGDRKWHSRCDPNFTKQSA